MLNFTARATFWKAETEYVQDDYQKCIVKFQTIYEFGTCQRRQREYKNVNYNIAYAYFKLKEYDQAATYFQNQIEKVQRR